MNDFLKKILKLNLHYNDSFKAANFFNWNFFCFFNKKKIQRHPKYKTDFCKTFHSKGFCPYGPRCHFIHDLNENFIEQQQQQQQLTGEAEATVASIQKTLRANKLNAAALKAAQKLHATADIDKKLQEIQSQLASTLLSNMDDSDLLKDQHQQQLQQTWVISSNSIYLK